MTRGRAFSGWASILLLSAVLLVARQQGGVSDVASNVLSDGHGHVGVYMTSYAMTKTSIVDGVLNALDRDLIDALVINVKNMHGEITYDSSVALAETIGSDIDRLDFPTLLAELKARGAYLIARQVLFYDPVLAAYLGYEDEWIPASDPTAVAYNLAIAAEVAELGFDEIQFDYVRYADGGELVAAYEERYEAVTSFLEQARALLAERVFVSADVFGRVLWSWNERLIDPIGQSLEQMGPLLDFISPMLYPSHYAEAAYQQEPYLVVSDALASGRSRYDVALRPYLQAFDRAIPSTMSLQTYILEQVQAAVDSGADGYLFWHPACEYEVLFSALEERAAHGKK